MKILIINGSPRKGNTAAAVSAFAAGLDKAHEVEILEADKYNISPCKACDACGCKTGCVAKDDSNLVADKIVAADMVVFATPVYWWGMSAQTKLVIDKLYCRGSVLGGKKLGLITVGASAVDNSQYRLIREQFECIAEYLNWEFLFSKAFSASAKSDLVRNTEALGELMAEGKKI